MIRALFKILALLLLLTGLILLIVDIAHSVAVSQIVTIPFLQVWQDYWPDGLASFFSFIEPYLVQDFLGRLLNLPAWLFFVIFSLLCLLIGSIGQKPAKIN